MDDATRAVQDIHAVALNFLPGNPVTVA